MTRKLISAVVLSVAAFGCRKEMPPPEAVTVSVPPLVEPDLGPGSRLVEPRAEALVRAMSDRLAKADALAFEADEVYDEVPEQARDNNSQAGVAWPCDAQTTWPATRRATPFTDRFTTTAACCP